VSQRTKLGLIAATLLLLGPPLLFAPDAHAIGGGFIRMGIVMGAVWLALPNFMQLLSRVPKWLAIATLVGACVVAWKWQTVVVIGPILAALWVIGPKWLARKDK
jgi:hypothetical protein